MVALLGLAADQATKYGVFGWLANVESHAFAIFQVEPVGRVFTTVSDSGPLDRMARRGFFLAVDFELRTSPDAPLVPHVNHGALFGFLSNYTTGANFLFAVISLVAAIAIVVWSVQPSTRKDRWLCLSLGLILAGTLGNLYDRMLFNGVRDFLHWHYGFNWPVFNLADCCLVIGAGLLMVQAFLAPIPTPDEKKDDAEQNLLGVSSMVRTGTPV